MAVRFPRHIRTLALGDKKNAMGQDCRGLAAGSRGYRKPPGHVVARSKKLLLPGPPGANTDALSFFTVTILLCAVALCASFIPARRAMRVGPMVVLRYE